MKHTTNLGWDKGDIFTKPVNGIDQSLRMGLPKRWDAHRIKIAVSVTPKFGGTA